MDKAPPLRGGGGEVKGKLKGRYLQIVSFVLLTSLLLYRLYPDGIISPLSLGGVRGGENRIVTPQFPSLPFGECEGDKNRIYPPQSPNGGRGDEGR